MNGKQLKNSILQWAIQGKLVPQDPNDEPASVLLERIRKEKERLVKKKKIKKDKNASIIFRGEDNSYYEKFLATGEVKCIDEEIPFEIPNGWEWCRLREVFNIWSARRVHEKDWRTSGIPFYRAREIGRLADYGYVENDLFIDRTLYEEFSKSGLPKIGDLMMTAVGTLGKTYIIQTDSPFYYKDGSVLCIGNPHKLNPDYLKMFFESSAFTNQYLSESDGTTVATLTMVRLNKYLIPIPPLVEQLRIVLRYKEITPLTNRYEQGQKALDRLNEEISDKLKKSTLQEAIQGKLAPQILEEGTAQELLEQIKQENKYYEQINNQIAQIECDYDFPSSWSIVRLSSICALIDGEKKDGQRICLDAKYLRGRSAGDYLQKGRFVQKGDNIILVDGENSGEVFAVPCDGYMGSTFKQLWVSSVMHLPYVLNFILFYKELLRKCKRGAAIPHLNKEVFYSLIIGIPPYQEQVRIVNKINEIYSKIKA